MAYDESTAWFRVQHCLKPLRFASYNFFVNRPSCYVINNNNCKKMYATYTIWQYEMCILRYIRLLTCQYRQVSWVFTLMSIPVTRKNHPTKQNISLVREEDSMKKNRLYARFLLINCGKCHEVQHVFEDCANTIHHVQELLLFWPKHCTAIQPCCCSCIILINATEGMVKH